MRKILLVALVAVFCINQAFAFTTSPTQTNSGKRLVKQVIVNPELLKKLFSCKSFANGIEMLIVTEDGERVSSVRGELSSPLNGNIAEAAYSFVCENAAIFNLPMNRSEEIVLKSDRVLQAGDGSHVSFQMFFNSMPVNGARIEIHTDRDGVVTLVNSSIPVISEVTNHIVLSKFQAIGKAREAIKAKTSRIVPTAAVQVFPLENGTGKIAYVTNLAVSEPLGDWEVIIDAETGEALSISNEMVFATGRGAVYLTHPLICEVTEEPLKNLDTHTLTGLYASVENFHAEESENENDVHVYEPTNTHFDEVNMYNYLNTIHDFYKDELGFDWIDRPILAIVHVGDKLDNAYFSPYDKSFGFGDGNDFNDLSKEDAVAYHEYAHAVLDAIHRFAYKGESGALNEGQADYFACSFTNDSKIGEWVCAKMGDPYLRTVENDTHYPEDIQGEVHADGKIWGATLWDLRNTLGKTISNQLIHKSHYYLKGEKPQFMDAYNALVTADKNLFDGQHLQEIEKTFANRGIVPESYNGSVLTAADLNRFRIFMEVHKEQ